jgi:16S rRNA (guanine966-N2)-methyltransferase
MNAARRQAAHTASGKPRKGAGRNRVRIIGGEWRSRLVTFPDAQGLRPTPDRVRETLFNWLGQRLTGLAVLDLFAGSGVLGFEALSRGAVRVVMVERDRRACDQLRATAKELAAEGLEIVGAEAIAWLGAGREKFDVAFVDPPYASEFADAALEKLAARLNPGARVYVESDRGLVQRGPPWKLMREGWAGAARFALYEFTEE